MLVDPGVFPSPGMILHGGFDPTIPTFPSHIDSEKVRRTPISVNLLRLSQGWPRREHREVTIEQCPKSPGYLLLAYRMNHYPVIFWNYNKTFIKDSYRKKQQHPDPPCMVYLPLFTSN